MPGFIGEHPFPCPPAATPFLAPDLLDASTFSGYAAGAERFDFFKEQSPGEKTIQPLLSGALAFDLDAGRPVREHDARGGFVHVLAAVAAGPDEGLFEVRFAHAQRLHPERELLLFIDADRETCHARKLMDLSVGRNGLPNRQRARTLEGKTNFTALEETAPASARWQAFGETACRGGGPDYCVGVKLLFIADIVGQPGRRAVRELVPVLRQRHGIQVVVANGENAAGGSGITLSTAQEIFSAGVDVITSGDHVWDQKEVVELLNNEPRFIRPMNYPADAPGQGSIIFRGDGLPPVAILNLQGRTFMPPLENPFHCALTEVERLRHSARVLLVDFHAEATSEKVALARMLDGRVSAVLGTHTHVQTADEQIFPGGTAFLCDAGFTGPHESVIGRDIDAIIRRFLTNMPQKFEVAKGRVLLQGALLDVDEHSGKAVSIQRVSEPLEPDF